MYVSHPGLFEQLLQKFVAVRPFYPFLSQPRTILAERFKPQLLPDVFLRKMPVARKSPAKLRVDVHRSRQRLYAQSVERIVGEQN